MAIRGCSMRSKLLSGSSVLTSSSQIRPLMYTCEIVTRPCSQALPMRSSAGVTKRSANCNGVESEAADSMIRFAVTRSNDSSALSNAKVNLDSMNRFSLDAHTGNGRFSFTRVPKYSLFV